MYSLDELLIFMFDVRIFVCFNLPSLIINREGNLSSWIINASWFMLAVSDFRLGIVFFYSEKLNTLPTQNIRWYFVEANRLFDFFNAASCSFCASRRLHVN